MFTAVAPTSVVFRTGIQRGAPAQCACPGAPGHTAPTLEEPQRCMLSGMSVMHAAWLCHVPMEASPPGREVQTRLFEGWEAGGRGRPEGYQADGGRRFPWGSRDYQPGPWGRGASWVEKTMLPASFQDAWVASGAELGNPRLPWRCGSRLTVWPMGPQAAPV